MLRAAGVGNGFRESSADLCASQRAHLVGGSSVTDQCHAGTALLIREYQVEYRRASLTPVAFSTASDLPVARPDPLDRSFHISSDR